MDSAELWLTPLLLVPGVALLVMSTSSRFAQVHSEIHDLASHKHDHDIHNLAINLDKRAVIFRNALVSLYLSITFLAVASLVGGIAVIWLGDLFYFVMGLSCLGIVCLVFAAIELIRESMITLEVIKEHCHQIEKE
ncbi:MAG: DUF2721 domain-containing protein [Candidatus Dadabacteria bacterium]|nr:DUF2721 domain-containing protein [Candidatus Dadabacteria bacterium]NIX15022.1 DUF2721 domain-containing protein [Candidatus Dadabacteria bacterium]